MNNKNLSSGPSSDQCPRCGYVLGTNSRCDTCKPPAGARDADYDYEWTRETMRLINELTPDVKGKAFDPDWFLLKQRFEQLERQALTGKADGSHGHAAASDELATKEVLVPCDCGCGRKCCAMCGNDLGFIAKPTRPAATGMDDHICILREMLANEFAEQDEGPPSFMAERAAIKAAIDSLAAQPAPVV